MENVITKIPNPHTVDQWFTFYCPGCKCNHFFTQAWQFNGDYLKPTVTPSLLVNGDLSNPSTPRCHIYVTDGRIQFLADCTHELAGQTVDMEPDNFSTQI